VGRPAPSTNDLVTVLFELVGLMCLLGDWRALYRDKSVKGVSLWARCVYGAWACWNTYFFSAMLMPFSAAVAAFSVFIYCIWLAMALRYRHEEKTR
jgi:hypothetical protein